MLAPCSLLHVLNPNSSDSATHRVAHDPPPTHNAESSGEEVPAIVLLQDDGGLAEAAVPLAVDVALHPLLDDNHLHRQNPIPLILQQLVIRILEYQDSFITRVNSTTPFPCI